MSDKKNQDKIDIRERPYTKDTVFLVCKWYGEGMTVKALASLLQRSEENVRKALEIGGVFDVTQKGGDANAEVS